jgi:hypothetical protein
MGYTAGNTSQRVLMMYVVILVSRVWTNKFNKNLTVGPGIVPLERFVNRMGQPIMYYPRRGNYFIMPCDTGGYCCM